jgi:hypothetical protein
MLLLVNHPDISQQDLAILPQNGACNKPPAFASGDDFSGLILRTKGLGLPVISAAFG